MPWADDKTNSFLQEDQPYFSWSSYQPAGEMQPTGDQNYGITDYLKNDFDWSSLPRDLLNIPVDSKWSLHHGMDDPLVQKMVAQGMSGLVPGGEGTGIVLGPGREALTELAENVPYRNILSKFLHDPNVVVPSIPQSYAEPLIAKSAGFDIAPIVKATGMPDVYSGVGGFRTSLPEGSMLATTTGRQHQTIPHEFGHFVQSAWQKEPVFGDALNKETLDLFGDLHPRLRDDILAKWGGYPGYDTSQRFANELAADLVNPETFAQRFPETISALNQNNQGLFTDLPPLKSGFGWPDLKESLSMRYPAVGAFWDEVPTRIPSSAYALPKGWE